MIAQFFSRLSPTLETNTMAEKRKSLLAGTWYNSDPKVLTLELDDWLSRAGEFEKAAKTIIAPHAAYGRAGQCSAYAYKQIDPEKVKCVFILGPSHNVAQEKCGVSSFKSCETPFYDIPVDVEINKELIETGEFEELKVEIEEKEHSLEMQMPYLAKMMGYPKTRDFTIVPIIVGEGDPEVYGKILAKYLVKPDTLFILSGDFCHWGKKFHFTKYKEEDGEIHESIAKLDKEGMDAIEKLTYQDFLDYLGSTGNTICGARPFLIFLGAVKEMVASHGIQMDKLKMKFLNYDQSSKVKTMEEHSVSYAAGVFTMDN